MQQLEPGKPGKQPLQWCPYKPMDTLDTWTLRGYVIGACTDVPATAPQWGRGAPPSPSGALLPILRLAGLVARRVSCTVTWWSERCIVRISM